jgi:hypothetical protein
MVPVGDDGVRVALGVNPRRSVPVAGTLHVTVTGPFAALEGGLGVTVTLPV